MALIKKNASTAYVGASNVNPLTFSDLLTNFPPSATYMNLYARVSDLYGSVDDIMRCRYDGTNYRWVPQREAFSGNNTATSGTISLVPIVSPPTLRITSNLTGNLSVVPTTTNAYIGQRFRVVQVGTLGLFTSTITGLIGSNLSLLGNSVKEIEFGPSGWFQSS
jgi:hypothetical protein